MKRTLITAMVFAAGAAVGAAAYAQGAHNHDMRQSEPLAGQGHDAHCCKPDTSDMKGMQGMGGHDQMHAPKKPAKKAAAKDAKQRSPEAK